MHSSVHYSDWRFYFWKGEKCWSAPWQDNWRLGPIVGFLGGKSNTLHCQGRIWFNHIAPTTGCLYMLPNNNGDLKKMSPHLFFIFKGLVSSRIQPLIMTQRPQLACLRIVTLVACPEPPGKTLFTLQQDFITSLGTLSMKNKTDNELQKRF